MSAEPNPGNYLPSSSRHIRAWEATRASQPVPEGHPPLWGRAALALEPHQEAGVAAAVLGGLAAVACLAFDLCPPWLGFAAGAALTIALFWVSDVSNHEPDAPPS